MEIPEAIEVSEAAKVNEAAQVSEARKITTEFFRVNQALGFKNLMRNSTFILMIQKKRIAGRIIKYQGALSDGGCRGQLMLLF